MAEKDALDEELVEQLRAEMEAEREQRAALLEELRRLTDEVRSERETPTKASAADRLRNAYGEDDDGDEVRRRRRKQGGKKKKKGARDGDDD